MGMERNIKITAYVKVVCPKKQEERTMHAACCGRVQKTNFCQSCGMKILVRTYSIEVDAVNHGDIADEIKEALCFLGANEDPIPGDNFDIWHPNDAGVVDEEVKGHHAITEEMIADAKTSIARLYAEQISVLAKHYGTQPEVCFGMLVWSA